MVQLALLLVGMQAIQRHWRSLALIGGGWIAIGVVVLIDPLDGVQDITMQTLGALLVIEGVVTLVAGLLTGGRGWLWVVRAAALVIPGLLIVDTPWRNYVLISILFGLALLADGAVRLTSTLLVRFPGWRVAIVGCGLEFVLAVLALTPWPISYQATVPFCVGVALMLSGWTVLRSAFLLRRLPAGAPITSLPIFEQQRGWHIPPMLPSALLSGAAFTVGGTEAGPRMMVHVWTPVASSADPVRRPLIDRYIAAVDESGTVATGHAALEIPPDLYISHYRGSEQDRTEQEFRQALNAGPQNDVPGRFLPSYANEVADWCEATEHVGFTRFDAGRLRAFWAAYRQDPTYNLTNRNCSVVVALALDVALEGVLGRGAAWLPLLRLIVHPDLHIATLLRKRAWTMTWTPGLVLDYARALHRVVEPPAMSWPAMIGHALSDYRQLRRDHPRSQAIAKQNRAA